MTSRYVAVVALAVTLLFTNSIVARAQSERLSVPGLLAPVEIATDRWGISHIYADNEHDLFFAQGYAAARDRLFQFEIWRRRATGTVAEILGRDEIERDIGARLHQFRGDMATELRHYHERGETIIPAFVDGINAYIDYALEHPDLLPVEFMLLGITPQHWTPQVVISRHQGLVSNVTSEINRAHAVAAIGADAVKELDYLIGNPDLTIDPVIDVTLLDPAILDRYRAFRRPIRFEAKHVVEAYRSDTVALQRFGAAVPSELDLRDADREAIGSNNWVIHGRRTATGYPIMANDPHRSIETPALRYWVHLVAPGWNVIGGGEPVLPGVSIGHNEYGAWGLTVFGQDNEDLMVYETNPSNPHQYKFLGQWEDMRIIEDTIPVQGEEPITVTLKYTRHGPVLFEDSTNQVAYGLRAAWLEYGAAPYLASLRMDQATTWEEFADACSYSRLPSENMVWADRSGVIGYQAVGISPVRPNHSGLVPVPGDGRYEWDGYLPIEALPQVVNPSKGYFATANNYTIHATPESYPHWDALHYTWGNQMRAARLEEVLSNGQHLGVVDSMQLQMDELSVAARNLVPLLREVPHLDDKTSAVRNLLLDWDFILNKHSVEASIYVSWRRRLHDAVRAVVVPELAQDYISGISTKRLIDWLAAPDGRFGVDPIAARDKLLRDSLSAAVEALAERFGTTDVTSWSYGSTRFKHALIRHPLSTAVNDDLRRRLDVGPLPRGGYGDTVHNTGGNDNQSSGASFMIIVDTENWDNSIGLSSPGQSGDPSSPHYQDLFELWAGDRYFPVFFSRAKVDSVVEARTVLQPESGITGETIR